PEVRTRLRVVGPDLLLVGEPGATPGSDDDGRLPILLRWKGGDPGRGDVEPRDTDALHALEREIGALACEVRCEVREVQTRTVRPIERPVLTGCRAERHGGIAVGDEAVLVVPGQGPDVAALLRSQRDAWV